MLVDPVTFRPSDEILMFIKGFEKLRLKAFRATKSEAYFTIGYGHYGADVAAGARITEEEAEALFEADIERKVLVFIRRRLAPYLVDAKALDVLTSLIYNAGPRVIQPKSTIMTAIEDNSPDSFRRGVALYDKQDGKRLMGLVCRRAAELNYLGPLPLVLSAPKTPLPTA